MSAIHKAQNISDLAEGLPKYCDYFKYLLVEELALETDYKQLHYGKCAVIGRLCSNVDCFKLENVTVPHLPNIYKLPTGAVSLLLLNFSYDSSHCSESLAHGAYCVVRGEVVLCNVEKPNSPTLSIRHLHEQLLQLDGNEVDESSFLEKVTNTYKPAVCVWHWNRIDQADTLVQRHLELRLLQ